MIFVLGYPSALGGANTELWHTLKLWRWAGIEVCLVPTPSSPARPEWRRRCDAIGVKTVVADPGLTAIAIGQLARVPGLRNSPVVSFCDPWLWACHNQLMALGCRTVWVGCMTELSLTERCMPVAQADCYVFQSEFQRETLAAQWAATGRPDPAAGRGVVIRGAYDFGWGCGCGVTAGPRPLRDPDATFTIGRLARPDPRKHSPDTWEIYGRCLHPGLRARVMGVDDAVLRRIGPPPSWGEVLPPCAEPARDFLRSLDVLCVCGAEAAENWPRVGLEAMAVGVPVVADDRGGWREMIRNGETGFLCRTQDDFAESLNSLSRDPVACAGIARAARRDLVERLASSAAIGRAWLNLFSTLE